MLEMDLSNKASPSAVRILQLIALVVFCLSLFAAIYHNEVGNFEKANFFILMAILVVMLKVYFALSNPVLKK